MSLIMITLFANIFTLLVLFVSIVFTVGIVWRVEKKLDVSYKLFLVALFLLVASEFMRVLFFEDAFLVTGAAVLKLFFSIFFLAGIAVMRDLIRDFDGEKN